MEPNYSQYTFNFYVKMSHHLKDILTLSALNSRVFAITF
jgi:hypothetical protein